MNVRSRRRIAALGVVLGLLLATGLTAAQAATSPYRGSLTYGKQTVHINCTGSPAVPTSITYAVSYDATHWNTSAPLTAWAEFSPPDPLSDQFVRETGAQVTLQAGRTGTISTTLPVPSNAVTLTLADVGLGTAGQMV